MQYRREIDGLRALAVLPVILFHAGFDFFSGGFVGVDIFFVISGYLITTIIISELENEKFSLITFYERRARRILPALFFVMLCCVPFAWFWLSPGDMKDFSQSLVAVPFFSSNILFWLQGGYFASAAELKPLLHTWSLAVEEQFYLFFPLMLMLVWKVARSWLLPLLLVIFVVSLGLAEWGSLSKPGATFYLLPTRGWELLLGSFAAFFIYYKKNSGLGFRALEVGGWLGLLLILVSILFFDKETPFPGFYALVPTIGTLLIIVCATDQNVVGKFVGNRVFVGVGLISYSAYLWHQPLFAFARHRSLNEPSEWMYGGLSLLALLLAYFSWRFIENPFRNKSRIDRSRVFLFSLAGSAVFVLFGLWGHYTNGIYMARPNIDIALSAESRLNANQGLSSICDINYTNSAECMTDPNPEVLLWGDSYAMHLAAGFISSNPSIRLVQKTVSVCGPILDIAPISSSYTRAWSEKCMANNDKVFQYLKDNPEIKYVVMSSPFNQVNEDQKVLTKDGRVVFGKDVAYSAMLETVNRIRAIGRKPVVFAPPPKNGENIGRCLMRATYFSEDLSLCDISLEDYKAHQFFVNDFLVRLESTVPVVWLSDTLCSSSFCYASIDGVFIYRDGGHLSHKGSAYVGKVMDFYEILESLDG